MLFRSRFFDVTLGKRIADIGQHFFKNSRHVGQVAGILWIDLRSGSLSAGRKTQQQVADALEADHELHAGEQVAAIFLWSLRNNPRDIGIDFEVDGVEIFFALPNGIKTGHRAGSDAFRGDGGSLARELTSLHRALDERSAVWLGRRRFDAGSAHKQNRIVNLMPDFSGGRPVINSKCDTHTHEKHISLLLRGRLRDGEFRVAISTDDGLASDLPTNLASGG